MATTSCGLVPQVICGEIFSALIKISSSYSAPSSEGRDFQNSTALSQSSPDGAYGLPLIYSKVFSSGAIYPALAPASMLILHIVILPSIDRLITEVPAYSMTWPVPPAVPIFPMI